VSLPLRLIKNAGTYKLAVRREKPNNPKPTSSKVHSSGSGNVVTFR
jgi:hypothetical protein